MEEQILIFRTSVKNVRDIKHIAALFTLCPQIYKWNVDMENWEKVLRIECQGITPTEISKALRAINIYAQELEGAMRPLINSPSTFFIFTLQSLIPSVCLLFHKSCDIREVP